MTLTLKIPRAVSGSGSFSRKGGEEEFLDTLGGDPYPSLESIMAAHSHPMVDTQYHSPTGGVAISKARVLPTHSKNSSKRGEVVVGATSHAPPPSSLLSLIINDKPATLCVGAKRYPVEIVWLVSLRAGVCVCVSWVTCGWDSFFFRDYGKSGKNSHSHRPTPQNLSCRMTS